MSDQKLTTLSWWSFLFCAVIYVISGLKAGDWLGTIGSILFLSSGYLAFAEVCHATWAWKPASISWWVVSINLLGCIGFMASALLSFVTPKEANQTVLMLAVGLTLQGAVCFFVGAILMMPEAAIEQDHTRETPASG